MDKKIKVKSTYAPKKAMDVNEWCEVYKVGSRIQKFSKENNAYYINSQYDFQKLFKPTEKFSFVDRLKNLILADLW
jgi:hypothetical protein